MMKSVLLLLVLFLFGDPVCWNWGNGPESEKKIVTGHLKPYKLIPNDPFFKYQVSLGNNGGEVIISKVSHRSRPFTLKLDSETHMNIVRAWQISTGSKQTIAALIDDGFYYDHEDIMQNIWNNKGEVGLDENGLSKRTNGIDDDNNGYIDDVIGWDFAFDDPDPDCYIFEGRDVSRIQPYWHSIAAMGIIGAKGNNGIGIAGINWEISMMLLKTSAQGNTSVEKRIENTAKAIRYAVDNGARVINWSGFVNETDLKKLKSLKEAIDYAEEKGILLVVAAGNSKRNIDLEENYLFPACFANDNIITVAESDFLGNLYVVPEGSKFIGGSNFGVVNVDIAAIAENYTTDLYHNNSTYRLGGGTSCAAPVVTGLVALISSVRPDLSGAEIKEILIKSSKKLPPLKGKILSGGIIDGYQALLTAKGL